MEEAMKALMIVETGKLAVTELPMPALRPYEVLVRMEACGICNSTDHKLIMGTFVPGHYPSALGHESTGQVVQLGTKVRHFKAGQRVLRPVLLDRHVPGGRSTWGGFAEYAIVIDRKAILEDGANEPVHWAAVKQQVLPASMTPEQAAAMITLKETLSCLQNFGVRAGSTVAVVGTGPVAQAFAHEAALLRAGEVVVFGRREAWRERFSALGVDQYMVGENWPIKIKEHVALGGFDYVIEAVGSREALKTALRLAGARGKVGLYGIPPEDAPYDPADRADRRVSVPRVEEADVHELMLDWVEKGKINFDQWYSAVFPWQDYARGFEMVSSNHAAKVILRFGG
jgi:threonine dehydrogenase-like Zn-dependent dehydrogenase